ncbi:MAG: cobalamin B12-binding domain-containing protein, partial [Halobacteriovoraceae bacterium]|nr:cobalamin B12-binding domain-containing protein [Halobacteriovoraceae bacterium]
GDYHEFGILQAALLCNHYQYSYYYLGPNLPVDSLLDAYESLEADTILIGSTVIPENKSIDFVNTYFEKAVKGIDKGKVLVGGNNHIDRIRLEKSKKGQFFNSLLDLDEFLKNY